MAVVSGPFLPILAVIAALVALFFAWKNNWLGIRDFGEKIWKSIKDGFEKFTEFISDLWEKVLGGFDEFFVNIWNSIVEFASGIWDKFKTGLKAFTDGIKTVWESAWNGISEFFTNIWNKIKETFEGMKTKFIESFSGFKTSLSTIWENTWDLIKSIIGNSVENIKGKAQNIIDGIKGVFDINWRELGENIIDGIIDGLRSGIDWVIEAAQNVAQAALDAIWNILDMGSPSGEFKKIGQLSIAGLVRGLEDIAPIKIAAQNAGETMLSAVQPMSFAHAGYSGGNVYNINVSSPGILDERDIANRIREAVRLIERGG
jgi:phage-related protein